MPRKDREAAFLVRRKSLDVNSMGRRTPCHGCTPCFLGSPCVRRRRDRTLIAHFSFGRPVRYRNLEF